MHFKRIEMQGFKSFADPVVVEFDKGITCVVGPNGSGKSNISDAIRWVLGEQSAKTLRGGKMEDIIFAGTQTRKSRGMAEVTLVIDNSKGLLDIDYSEVAVTRRMYRSGESEYSINNNPCRMKDIRELFMDTGIGVDGYSLIGQGKISDIISNKAESIREIFEETAGVVMYRTKKSKAESKLKATTDNMDRVNDIVSEIEGRIDGLKEDSEKAEEYVKLRERYKELEINITLKNIESIEEKSLILKEDIKEIQKTVEGKRTERAALDDMLAELQDSNEKLEIEGNSAREDLMKAVEQAGIISSEKEINEERILSKEKDEIRLKKEVEDIELSIFKEKENLEAQEEAQEEAIKRAANLEENLKEKSQRFENISQKNQEDLKIIDSAKSKIFELHNEISRKNSQRDRLIELRETMETQKAMIIEEESEKSENFKDTELNKLVLQKEKMVLEGKYEEIIKAGRELRKTQEQSILREKESQTRIENLRVKIGQTVARKKTIEEMESNYEGYNGAVKFLMSGRKDGIEGVVAELIEVPSGYEVALETALGAGLQNVICHKDEDAKRAINQLKERKAGRLTFLPINSIRPRRREKTDLSDLRGFKGYAVDCIEFNPKYENVMEHLLGNVVIADNMDNAIAMAKKESRVRYVTLEGEVISSGGAITGGKYKNKTANILERRAEITKLSEEAESLEKEFVKESQQLENLRELLSSIGGNIEEKAVQARTVEKEVDDKSNKLTVIGATLSDFKESKERREQELQNIERQQEEFEKETELISREIKTVEEEKLQTEQKIEELLSKTEADRKAIGALGEEITKVRIELSNSETEKNKIQTIYGIIKETYENFQLSKKEKLEEIENIEKEKQTFLEGKTDTKEILEILSAKKSELEKSIEKITDEKANKMAMLNKAIEEKDHLDAEAERLQNQKYELEIKDAKQETQLDNYKNKLWEEFDISYMGALEYKKEDFIISTAIRENREIKNRMKELGEVNIGSIKEYESVKERYDFLIEQREDIESSVNELSKIIKDMDKIIKTKFKETFDQVVTNFEVIFSEFFGGGTATITIDNEDNPLEAVIEINAQPPGKQLKHINLLSGGEKTMTAIALMFAVLKTKPTPCCILDEIEAALDDANIEIFAKYLRKFEEIQFTLITHQKATMEHADVMYGVTMPERGISKIYSLKMDRD